MRKSRFVTRGLPRSTVFLRINSETVRFSEKVTEQKMCVLIFSTNFSETFLILRRNGLDIIKNVYWSSRNAPFILVRF